MDGVGCPPIATAGATGFGVFVGSDEDTVSFGERRVLIVPLEGGTVELTAAAVAVVVL